MTEALDNSFRIVSNFKSCAASPLATPKLARKLHRLIYQASQRKIVCKGVKSVIRALRREKKGIVLIGANNSVIDSFIHIVQICLDDGIRFCFLPTSEEMSIAANEVPKNICILIPYHQDLEQLYSKCDRKIMKLSDAPRDVK
ncbi:MAG: snoRNA-binding protein [Marteilia pararefringens]